MKLSKFKLSIAMLMMTLASCSPDVENRGYVTKFSDFSKIKVGKTTKGEALQVLGSPTTKSLYGDDKWIYLGSEVSKETFFEPEVKSYKAYEITFNDKGIVKDMKTKTKSDMREFAISGDRTATSGNEVTLLQQLLGNLGKFNPGRRGPGGAR
jgi:outer membrane protein assembly factor BamE (lipoprotein component of BamABCDE complex)